MTRAVVLVAAAAAVLAAAVPAASDGDVRERNREWLLAGLGPAFDPQASYTGTVGGAAVALSGAEVLDLAVARLGAVDAAALAAQAVASQGADVGDLWLIGFGPGTCGPSWRIMESPIPGIPIDGQLWLYSDWLGLHQASGFTGFGIGWSTKTLGTFGPDPVHYGGDVAEFCIDGLLLFPFLDGFWSAEP